MKIIPLLSIFLLLFVSIAVKSHADNVKVILMGGQSNMLGRAPSIGLPLALQEAQRDVLFFGGSDGTVGTTLEVLRPDGKNANEFGPEVTFGRTIADGSPTTKYALIKYAAGGTALYNDWAPGTGAQYTAFRDTVTAGLAALQAAGHTTEIVGMAWHQGESDAIENQQANYATNLTAFIADIRTNYGANLPFLIGEIRRSNGAKFVTVADAQIAVAAADPNAIFVPASDLTFRDTYHFDAPSMITLGERFAAGFAVPPNNFATWISNPDYELQPAEQGTGLDPDGDGLPNAVEAWMGTHPGEFNVGMTAVGSDGTTSTFNHPATDDPPEDLSVSYEWSPNLEDWYSTGNGPNGAATVNITTSTADSITTVTAISSSPTVRLFTRIRANLVTP